ncbi:MAG: type IX secretion system protein PorQ [Bacteroidetes bacterium]|nr:type IX secretion system protein PorQ [Bacteroidota bacterium]
MLKSKSLQFLLICFIAIPAFTAAQIGGEQTYSFLKAPYAARIAAMGGNFLAVNDQDIMLVLPNPSLISPEIHNHLGLGYVNTFAGINYGHVSYARAFNKIGSFAGTFQFIDYGKFTYADESGQTAGNFRASEYALNIGWGRGLSQRFSIGSNFKMIYSSLESYNSFGLAVDVAGSYTSGNKLFTGSLIAGNIGLQLKGYTSGNPESLPFELKAGISQQFRHLPFRLSILVNHLEKWDLNDEDDLDPNINKDPITGEPEKKSGIEDFGDNLLRHIVVGGEVTIAKSFFIRGGYNYQRRQEMKVSTKSALVGFSWGVGLRIKMFQINYARSTYHLAGSPNFISVAVNLASFNKSHEDKPGE